MKKNSKESSSKERKKIPRNFHIAPSYLYDDNYSDYAKSEGFRAYQDYSESGLSADQEPCGQHSGKGPKGYKRSDERINEDVCEALSQNAEIDATEIEVKVKGGIVNLSGTVESRHIKRLAEQIIDNLSGIVDIQNELRIDTTLASRGKTHA
jgi:osmotically-inducible protein OsmY